MAYEVTATRRRPQKFEDLVGQDFVVATLKNAIQSGKIAHAYLFSGPRGCGKTSSARILAKALNCQNGPISVPCEECSNCREITKGSSLDVIEIDGASNRGIDDVRQIKDEVLFPPQSSRYKIYIIDEVHMLSNEAFNALLKTIEEPPEYVIFIFATTELHKVPATIKSRCQQFHFRLGSVEQIKEVLEKAAAEIQIKADEEALYWVAREANGSFRDAYTLFDQVVAFSEDHITYEKIRDKLGLVGTERLNELSELCVDGNSKAALEKLDSLITSGVSIEQFVSNYADYLRSLLLIESGIQKESLLGQNVSRYSKKVLENWNRIKLERALSLFLNLYRDVRYSLSPRYETELAVTRICWLSQYVSNGEVKTAIEQAKELLLAGSSGTKKQSGADTENPPGIQRSEKRAENPNPFLSSAIQNDDSAMNIAEQNEQNQSDFYDVNLVRNATNLTIEEVKNAVLEECNSSNRTLFSLLTQSKKWTFEDGVVTISLENAFLENQFSSRALEISELISKIWGKKVSIKPKRYSQQEEDVPEDLPEKIKAIKDMVRGKVISISPAARGEPTTGQVKQENSFKKEDDSEEIDSTESYDDIGDNDEL